jgi:hypothetical protein
VLSLRFNRDGLPFFPRLEPAFVISFRKLQGTGTEKAPQRGIFGVDDLQERRR